jgi:hypothetical protein
MKTFSFLSISILMLMGHALRAQDRQQIDAVYKNALLLYEQKDTFKAIAEFEKVVQLDADHKDALYHLATINYALGDQPTAIKFLKRGVHLHDKRALTFLRDQLHQKITYADTMQYIDPATSEKFDKIKNLNASTLNDITKNILSVSSNTREQLQLLLLWSHHAMRADGARFFNGGFPLSTQQAIQKRTGLCDEYSNIVDEFCKKIKVQSFRVTGYVRYPDFQPGDALRQTNHAWNFVYLDSSWVACDLFWSTTALDAEGSTPPHFVKRLEPEYFLGLPSDFLYHHLPADPVFQFDSQPVKVEAFANSPDGIDPQVKRMPYLNYQDSVKILWKLTPEKRLLKMARHSYSYNKDNPNELIKESYNYAVGVLNDKVSTKSDLKSAKQSLALAKSLIPLSKDGDIKALMESCDAGLTMADKRLATAK